MPARGCAVGPGPTAFLRAAAPDPKRGGRRATRPPKERARSWDCKPGSVPSTLRHRAMAISLGGGLLRSSSDLPERSFTNRTGWSRYEPLSFLLGLAPGGVYQAERVTPPAGELLPHRFTLTALPQGNAAVCFLWHSPWPCDRSALPTTLSYGARTFLSSNEQVVDQRPSLPRWRPSPIIAAFSRAARPCPHPSWFASYRRESAA